VTDLDDPVGNLCHLHRAISRRMGDKAALKYQVDGHYQDISYTDVRRQADQAAAGLISLGIQPGDRIGLLSENRVEWPMADLAVLSTAAADVTMHAPLSAEQIEYQLQDSEARAILVSNQDQADKVVARLDKLPNLEFLVSFDPVSLDAISPHHIRPTQLDWQELCHRGTLANLDNEIAKREDALDASSLATLIYTSGTTGNPKGVMLTHGNLLSNVQAMMQVAFLEPDDILLSWLPYSHIYARLTDNYLASAAGITVALARNIDSLLDDLDTIQPTWLTAVPRFYEKLWNAVEALDTDARNSRLVEIFGPRIRQLNSGGAPLPRHVCDGFAEAGVPIYEGYGLTETSPVITFNHAQAFRFGSVGRLLTADPLFEQAVVYGDGRNFISAVVVPNLDLLESVAENLGCAIDCQDGCVTTTQLLDYIDSKVQQLMQVVSQPERVKKCLVLEKPFGLEDDELTATLKVRRRHIIDKYEDRLEAFYNQ
jgi:long-chain acyl-CoA synthetase